MADDPARDAQDPEATPDRRPVGPANPRVRFLTIALIVAVVVLVAWVVVSTLILR